MQIDVKKFKYQVLQNYVTFDIFYNQSGLK